MKKSTITFACLGLLVLASCKKDRTCTCTVTDTSGSTVNVVTVTATVTKVSKGEAKDFCANSSETDTYSGSSTSSKTDCKLN